MSSVAASTIWPALSISAEAKQLVDHFFTLVDSKFSDSGERIANEIFTKDGIFILADGTFKGTAEISTSRKTSWKSITFRHHEILKVYADYSGTDFILIGRLRVQTALGQESVRQFVARIETEQTPSGLRLRQYRIIDPAAKDSPPYFITTQSMETR
ncbi:hypothetical protein NOF04DRAFT_1282760 [Fusarium oxysporum II5]|nr:hypothetical protein NOF04DRAFT_1282760 [Fusarium oxysporum II5]